MQKLFNWIWNLDYYGRWISSWFQLVSASDKRLYIVKLIAGFESNNKPHIYIYIYIEKELVVASEIEDNPSHREASNHESQIEGMHSNSGKLVQAIVAARGFISMLSSAILSNIGPAQLNKGRWYVNISNQITPEYLTIKQVLLISNGPQKFLLTPKGSHHSVKTTSWSKYTKYLWQKRRGKWCWNCRDRRWNYFP